MKKTSVGGSDAVRAQIAGWLADEEHRKMLARILRGIDTSVVTKLEEDRGTLSSFPATLQEYVRWYMKEKQYRLKLLQKIPSGNAAQHTATSLLQDNIERSGRALQKSEISAILSSPDSFARYLCSLSVAQLETYKRSLARSTIKLDPKARKAFIKLLNIVQEERFAFEQEWAKTVGPLAWGISNALQIQEKIQELESLQKSLS